MQTSITKELTIFKKAQHYHIAIVCAQFNTNITEKILTHTLKTLTEYNIDEQHIDIEYVAGSVEIPITLQIMAKKNTYDCMIAIGSVIKGKTNHYDVVIKMLSEGIMRVMLDHTLPIGFAVLTTDNEQDALERVSIGTNAVHAALHVTQKK